MPVVAHDAVAAQPHIEPLDALSKDPLKSLEVRTLFEYPQSTVGTVENVINDIAFIYSFLSWHNQRL